MGSPIITTEPDVALAERISQFLPQQGSFEYQHDQPGKTHNWHRHSLNEVLFVLEGSMEIFWLDNRVVQRHSCPPRTKIVLPAGTVHGSTAGQDGCSYIIAPQDGATAVTSFLDVGEYPRT
jgi:quercetin dioxygenase-like cupin family protein